MFLYNNPCPLIIDEAQKCPTIFSKIKIVLDKVKESKRGMGAIICMYDKKLYLRENLKVLPINY